MLRLNASRGEVGGRLVRDLLDYGFADCWSAYAF